MRRAFAVALILALSTPLAVPPALAAETVVAEAPPVGPFDRLTVSGDAEVILVQGDREGVTVEAAPKTGTRARVRVRAQDGRLTIEAGERGSWRDMFGGGSSRRPTITVRFRELSALRVGGAIKLTASALEARALRVDASGAASIRIDALKADELRFSGSGAVTTEIAGSANGQEIRISGAGDYRAPKFVVNDAKVRVSGAGKVIVNAQKTLDATLSGAGEIEYYGNPKVTQRVSGAGSIVRRSAADVLPHPLAPRETLSAPSPAGESSPA